MSLRNTQSEYGSLAKFFHWSIFLLVVGLIFLGFWINLFPDSAGASGFNWHKLLGLVTLVFVILRLAWVLVNPKPKLPGQPSLSVKVLERLVHFMIYICLFIMPLSGWIMATAAAKPPKFMGHALNFPGILPQNSLRDSMGQVHYITIWVLIGLLTLHIAAALKHHFWEKDDVLKRMWFK